MADVTLNEQVLALMMDGRTRTITEIARHVGAPEASISARLRDLRKAQFGAWDVKRKKISESTYGYTVTAGAAKPKTRVDREEDAFKAGFEYALELVGNMPSPVDTGDLEFIPRVTYAHYLKENEG
jgi:hypothetical protein